MRLKRDISRNEYKKTAAAVFLYVLFHFFNINVVIVNAEFII